MSFYYYDTCIFEHAINSAHENHADCKRITSGVEIDWSIANCSELTLSEAPIDELLAQFEAEWARQGIVYVAVPLVSAREFGKSREPLKRKLRAMSFQGNDWLHLCAALAASASRFVTSDEDYFDPANKRNRGAKRKSDAVKRLIKSELEISVVRPVECPVAR